MNGVNDEFARPRLNDVNVRINLDLRYQNVLETSILSWQVRREPGVVGKIAGHARGSTAATTAFLEPAAPEPAAREPAAL